MELAVVAMAFTGYASAAYCGIYCALPLLRLGHFHKTFGRRSFRTNGTDTSVWAKELEGSPITVNVLVPGGPTDTPMISDRVAARKNAAAGNHGPAHRLSALQPLPPDLDPGIVGVASEIAAGSGRAGDQPRFQRIKHDPGNPGLVKLTRRYEEAVRPLRRTSVSSEQQAT